jgi:5-methylcytosine-specific restriction endonuclease McrA
MTADLKTLILSPWMAPHRIAHWHDAIVLAVTEKADTLESYDVVCASPSVSLQIPAVMRLRKEMRATKKNVKFSRQNIYQRDRYVCCYDGKQYAARDLTYDHVIPRSRWKGPVAEMTSWLNIVTCCKPCNTKKDSRTPLEAGMRMYYQPFVPRVLSMTAPFVVDVAKMPAQWEPYVRSMLARTA